MAYQRIVVNGVAYTHDQIRGSGSQGTDFEQSTFEFCRLWLSEQQSFSLSTSGSTGLPKKISFSRDQMISSARMTEKALGLKPDDTALVCLDTNYIAGRMMLVRSFVTGMNIIATAPSANPLLEIPKKEKINFAAFVPYQLQSILNSSPDGLDEINVAIIGGAPIDPALKQKLSNVKCQLYATYGMTETISHVALMKLNGENVSAHYEVLPGITIRQDERSCLVIKAGFLASEIITNDVVEIIGEGQFNWIGRWDNVINTGAIKVVPEKVEKIIAPLFDHLKLKNRFFLTGLNDQQLGQRVCLVIEGVSLEDHMIDQLWDILKTHVSKFELPKEIKFVDKFLETKTGKINRSQTINLFPA